MDIQEQFLKTGQPTWQLYVDGAARNNPGPAGAGVIIAKNNTLLFKGGFFLGNKTNNQAEYIALLLGLFLLIHKFHIKEYVHIFADSELIVRQLRGTYKVKNTLLIPLYAAAKDFLTHITGSITHIPRSENSYADAMANHGIETKRALPEEFALFLSKIH